MSEMTIKVYEESDYSKFKHLKGNRDLNQSHVKRLIAEFTSHGNFAKDNPIEVDEDMNVLDGQHRLAALESLKWPVYYKIGSGKTVDQVRQENMGRRNWNFTDVATSYAELGNKNYQQFIQLAQKTGLQFSVIVLFAGGIVSGNRKAFNRGDLKIKDYDGALEKLELYKEISDSILWNTSQLAYGVYRVLQHPEYDHAHMLQSLRLYGVSLRACNGRLDYFITLSDIYNRRLEEADKLKFV